MSKFGALRCSLWIALLGGSSVYSAPQSLLKIESDINGILPAGGGPLPTSEVVRQVEEEAEFLFATALR
jgi:hypothetical protein